MQEMCQTWISSSLTNLIVECIKLDMLSHPPEFVGNHNHVVQTSSEEIVTPSTEDAISLELTPCQAAETSYRNVQYHSPNPNKSP